MKVKTWKIWALACGLLIMAVSGFWYYTQTKNFMAAAGGKVSQLASQALETEVEIGEIEVSSLSDIKLHNLTIYDKQAELIARADEARVSYRLLAAVSDPADAVKEISVTGVKAVLTERADGSWNVQDLLSGESSNQEFHGKVTVADGQLTVRRQGQELQLDNVQAAVDMGTYPVAKAKFSANNAGADLAGTATISDSRQIINAKVSGADLANYISYLPQGLLPDNVVIKGGRIEQGSFNLYRREDNISFSGDVDLREGAVTVEGTDIEHITGHAAFTNEELLLNAQAESNGQKASVHGKIKHLQTVPYMELEAAGEEFDPSRILQNIPYSGGVNFKAKITGAFSNPSIDGRVEVPAGQAMDVPFSGGVAEVRYQDKNLFVRNFAALVMGGKVSGELVLSTENLGYTAHVKVEDLDVAQAAGMVPNLAGAAGRLSADLGGNGIGADMSTLQLYGSASLKNAAYQGLQVDSASASLHLSDDDLQIDYLSLNMPNHSSLGVEGSILDMRGQAKLNLDFYGGHVDLSQFRNIDERIDLSGLADFKGTVRGDRHNPRVEIKFAGNHGRIFKQPYDSLKFAASGSLDGVGIDDFLMEKDGKEVWRAAGSVGFTGDKKINLQLDTMGARMEDIMALIAPDQPLTGNVDNIIKVTGTLDKPQAVGYIHFYRGSYHGMLLSGMDGDYFLENGVLRLQDFHAYSPMIDMVLNGNLITATQALDMEVEAQDIDLKRVQHKLPYEVSGHGTFKGKILGTVQRPEFYGLLDAPQIILNDQVIDNLHGMVKYRNDKFDIDHFGFEQQGGTYDMELSYDTQSEALDGDVVIAGAEISAVAALVNQKTEVISGKADLTAHIGGTAGNPSVKVNGNIEQGLAGGYDIHGVAVDMQLINRILYINQLKGSQGDEGTFAASGTVALDGPIAAKFTAQQLDFGMFTGLAGVKAQGVTGKADIEAEFGGYINNPSADVTLKAVNGGIQGAAFDSMTGQVNLKNGLLSVKSLRVNKQVGERNCAVDIKGIVPMRALTAGKDEWLDDYEQIQLTVGLEDADLSLLPTLSPQIDWAMGATAGDIKIHGTLAHPLIDGSIQIPAGAMKLKFLDLPVTDMAAKVKFTGNKVTVEEFFGKMGGGTYNLQGNLTMDGWQPEHYDFSLVCNALGIKSKFFTGPLNAEFHLGDTNFYGRQLPKISGKVDFHDCQVSVPTIPDSDGGMPEMVFDVQVNVGKKVHFYSAYLYDLYLDGAFHVGGITSHPKMSGSLKVKRGGTINYLKTEFNIRQGVANFNQVASFMPSIDFFADTRLTQARVFLSVKGPLGAANMRLSASPAMSQTQIIQLLTLRDAYRHGQTNMNAGDMLVVGLQMSFLSEIESAMREYLYLDRLAISRGSGSAFSNRNNTTEKEINENKYDFNISMGKYIADRVMLRYTRGLGGDNINRYGFQYDLSDNVGLTLERESGGYIMGVEARFNF